MFLINDIRQRADVASVFELFGFTVLDCEAMTRQLVDWAGWKGLSEQSTLLVFPGNGAEILRSYLPESWLCRWRWCSCSANRLWLPGSDPVAFAGRISSAMLLGYTDLVVLDDVVSSGATIKVLRRANEAWVPGARWHVATWIAQRAAALRGFESVFAAELTGTRTAKAPVNSLSTLVSVPAIAESLANRKLSPENRERFLELLARLRDE